MEEQQKGQMYGNINTMEQMLKNGNYKKMKMEVIAFHLKRVDYI